ncbi:Dclk3 [Symbiodinium natans]|uniref:Dclk3 protein n=1 Tax=Symbiodinium natans TaxID=878477 RepID=A0A812TWF1_9DINO|nr:Dclk3 [Symbiodinium natans]
MLLRYSLKLKCCWTSCRHPRVLYAYGIACEYLLCELMGGSLEDARYWNAPLPAPLVVTTMSEILEGLAHLHRLSVVHRDIKPENIMVANSAKAPFGCKLGDFGLAVRLTGALTQRVGTAGFTAPEMLLNTGYATGVDVWACGLTGFWLLYGRLPWDAKLKLVDEIQRKPIGP